MNKKMLSFVFAIILVSIYSTSLASASKVAEELSAQMAYYKIKVERDDWVEYEITEVSGKVIIPTEFNATFPRVWVSLNKNASLFVEVLDKKVMKFGNYSREFAIINVTIDGRPIIPFRFFEKIESVEQLPLDGFTPFMPLDESYWNDFEQLVKFWADQAKSYGFQVTHQIRKCFYRLRVDHSLIGWVEVSLSYDDCYGVLKELSLAFSLTQEFVQKINERIGNISVDGKPFQFQAGELYRIKIAMSDTNIPALVNSVEFGSDFADALNKAMEDGVIGMFITLKASPEGNETLTRFETVSSEMNASISSITPNKIRVEVTSVTSTGKVLVFNINRDVFSIQKSDELQVLVNGEKAQLASNYDDVLNPLDEDKPEYFVSIGSKFIQVIVSIPHFSTYSIEIVKVPPSIFSYLVYVGVGVAACIALILLAKRVIGKHGN